ELVEADVELEHGDVDGDDTREQDGEHDDPDDAAERTAPRAALRCSLRPGTRTRPRARDGRRVDLGGPGPARHHSPTFMAARSFAEAARGLASSSRAPGRTGLRVRSRRTGSLPQTQIGNSGGHVQPRACSRTNCFTIRSSSEWKLMTAMRPPGLSIRIAAGSAASSAPSSSLTAI